MNAINCLSQVCEVTVSLNGVYEEILVVASDGTLATDIRPLVRFSCSVLIEKNPILNRKGKAIIEKICHRRLTPSNKRGEIFKKSPDFSRPPADVNFP